MRISGVASGVNPPSRSAQQVLAPAKLMFDRRGPRYLTRLLVTLDASLVSPELV
jgi:hypothetical protein